MCATVFFELIISAKRRYHSLKDIYHMSTTPLISLWNIVVIITHNHQPIPSRSPWEVSFLQAECITLACRMAWILSHGPIILPERSLVLMTPERSKIAL